MKFGFQGEFLDGKCSRGVHTYSAVRSNMVDLSVSAQHHIDPGFVSMMIEKNIYYRIVYLLALHLFSDTTCSIYTDKLKDCTKYKECRITHVI